MLSSSYILVHEFDTLVYWTLICEFVNPADDTYLFMPLIQIARSLVIIPDSMVSIQALSRSSENFFRASLLSSLARCASPLVQAKMEARKIRNFQNVQIFSNSWFQNQIAVYHFEDPWTFVSMYTFICNIFNVSRILKTSKHSFFKIIK